MESDGGLAMWVPSSSLRVLRCRYCFSSRRLRLRRSLRLGKTLHPKQGTLVAQDGEDPHQQHPPLRVAHPTPLAAVGQRLEEVDQIGCGRGVLQWRGQGCAARRGQQTAALESPLGLLGQTSNGPLRSGRSSGCCHQAAWSAEPS